MGAPADLKQFREAYAGLLMALIVKYGLDNEVYLTDEEIDAAKKFQLQLVRDVTDGKHIRVRKG